MRCWRRVCCTRLKTEAMATPRGVGNEGQIPIARRSFAGREPCFTHLGSYPYWRVGANGDPWPGCAPGGAVPFFCVAKRKAPKKRPPPLPAPSARATGTCGARFGRGPARTRLRLRQSRALIRPKQRSSAHLEGDPGYGIGGAQRRIAPRARMPPSPPSPGGGRGKTVNARTHRGAHRHFSLPHRGGPGWGHLAP